MTRQNATTRDNALQRIAAGERSSIVPFRVPESIINLGVTDMWDFRTGFSAENSPIVVPSIGNTQFNWRGTTAISSVYTAGKYRADLERSSSDYFLSNPQVRYFDAALTVFAWLKRESTSLLMSVLSNWETVGGNRCFVLRLTAANQGELVLSANGSNQALYTTTGTIDASNWVFLAATYNTTDRAKIYFNNAEQITTLTSGVNPATINSNANTGLMLGANTPSSPTSLFDGMIGICGFVLVSL